MSFWNRVVTRFGRRRASLMAYLSVIGLAGLVMQLLLYKHLYHSSLLYVLVPYGISMTITLMRSAESPKSLVGQYFSHLTTALTILLSTSILIGEGFICITFFAPIYLIVVSLTYLTRAKFGKNRTYACAFPVLIILMSMEGTTAGLSLPRQSVVEVARTTSLSVEEVKSNLAKPFDLRKDRHWLISIFPMPYRIEAGSVNPGDIHRVYTRYHRWFFTNTHEGVAELLIDSVDEHKIVTKVLSDTTYFSTYLSGSGTDIELMPTKQGGTHIKLRIHYRRNLDPAWYFHYLQKIGVSKMGELIIDELLVRNEGGQV